MKDIPFKKKRVRLYKVGNRIAFIQSNGYTYDESLRYIRSRLLGVFDRDNNKYIPNYLLPYEA